MYIHFHFTDSNDYIAISNKKVFQMLCKYDTIQTDEQFFTVLGEISHKPKTRTEFKEALRNIAQEWQNNAFKLNYSYGQLIAWGDFFTAYGRKYGLLREFKTNGII